MINPQTFIDAVSTGKSSNSKDYYINPSDYVREIVDRGLFYPYQYWVSIDDQTKLGNKISNAGFNIRYTPETGTASVDSKSKKSHLLNDDLSFQAIGCKVPGLGISDVQFTPLYQSAIKIPIKETREPMDITFRSSDTLYEWNFFMQWHRYIAGYQKVRFRDDYCSDIKVVLFKRVEVSSAQLNSMVTAADKKGGITNQLSDKALAGKNDGIFSPSNIASVFNKISGKTDSNNWKIHSYGDIIVAERPFAVITYLNAFPASIEGLELKSDAAMSSYHTFKVLFEYENYSIEIINPDSDDSSSGVMSSLFNAAMSIIGR